MNLYFKPEWRVPALVGAVSFSAGVGVGILGLTVKQRRDSRIERENNWHSGEGIVDEANMMGMHVVNKQQMTLDFVEASKANTNDPNVTIFEWTCPPEPEDVTESINGGEEFPPSALDDIITPRGWVNKVAPPRPVEGPYVISADEFHSSTTGYKQLDLEYFAEDNVLCDEVRVPIYNFDAIVGPLPFGEMSGDSNVVYIRNEQLKGEWEITRIPTSYLAEVHGIQMEEDAEAEEEDELRHSNRVLKFRDY